MVSTVSTSNEIALRPHRNSEGSANLSHKISDGPIVFNNVTSAFGSVVPVVTSTSEDPFTCNHVPGTWFTPPDVGGEATKFTTIIGGSAYQLAGSGVQSSLPAPSCPTSYLPLPGSPTQHNPPIYDNFVYSDSWYLEPFLNSKNTLAQPAVAPIGAQFGLGPDPQPYHFPSNTPTSSSVTHPECGILHK